MVDDYRELGGLSLRNIFLALFVLLCACSSVHAESFYWCLNESRCDWNAVEYNQRRYSSVQDFLDAAKTYHAEMAPHLAISAYVEYVPSYDTVYARIQGVLSDGRLILSLPGILGMHGDSCDNGVFNPGTSTCEAPFLNLKRRQLGDQHNIACAATNSDGSKINHAIGNLYLAEVDYSSVNSPVQLVRYYNSDSGVWSFSYSSRMVPSPDNMTVTMDTGVQVRFGVDQGRYVPESAELGSLISDGEGWRYLSPSKEIFTYDHSGVLISLHKADGSDISVRHSMDRLTGNENVMVVDSQGRTLAMVKDLFGRVLSASFDQVIFDYGYVNTNLSSVTRSVGPYSEIKTYTYGDVKNFKGLTRVIDVGGGGGSSWAYDNQGRVVSGYRGSGAGLTQIIYNSDGSSTLVNELGKSTTYRYQQIGGVKRVTSVEGEPSAGCEASNSSYTYNNRGQVLTKIDAKGLITTYTYNDRGLEISRTEASGTSLARTVTTEWDPARFLPMRVVEPDRTTVYSYDEQGRELSRQTTSHH